MKFDFTENGIDYADGTGTYEKGYYAAAPSSIVGDGDPDEGPIGYA